MYAATVRGTGSVPLESHHANEVVELNVGGTLYTTRYHTLVGTNSAFFGTMFRIDRSGRVAINPYNVARDAQGRIFIDRCGKLFRHVLQFLRDGRHTVLPDDATLLKQISREAEFFGIEGLESMIADRLLISPSSHTELLERAVNELSLAGSRSQYTR